MSQADVALLRALRAAGSSGVSVKQLEAISGLTNGELVDVIGEFRSADYCFEERDGCYFLRAAPDRLIGADVRAGLGDLIIGREILVLEKTSSTNDFLQQIVAPNVQEGIVVFAEKQTAGRGQHGKQWSSPARQGLWFSILLRPKIEVAESARLTNWIAHSLEATITRELELVALVKPPNDVYIADRKVAGILVEMRVHGKTHVAIAGIGINVNQQLADFPPELRERAGSLAMAKGRLLDRRELAVAVLRDLDRSYRATFAP